MKAWLSDLFSAQGPNDSIIVGGLASLLVLFGMTGWDVVKLHHDFGAATFAGACAVILGAIGGAKRLRDGAQQ